MKKNLLSDSRKGTKGFYAALGISAVMVGSACYYAYDQSKELTEQLTAKNSITEQAAVDRKVTDIPKPVTTSPAYRETTIVLTAAVSERVTTPVTLPAAVIEVQPEEPAQEVAAEPEAEEVLSYGNGHLENVKPPLADMSSIIEPFSGKELVRSETTGSWQTHNGTDIGAEVGSEVYAVSNGEIMDVSEDPVWGVTLTLNHHNGFVTRYCGLASEVAVQPGDMVASGDILGTVGNTADIESALAPHLHIEIQQNGEYIDPLSAMR